MILTRNENPVEIKKYDHIKPAPTFGPLRCFARLPGSVVTCTLTRGHSGPHIAHTGVFKKVVGAVWEDETTYAFEEHGGSADTKPIEHTIINCPNLHCGKKLRVPKWQRLEVSCPVCNHKFEYTP